MKRGSRRLRWAIDLAICAVLLYTGIDITTNYESSQGAGVDTNVDTLLIPTLILPLLLRHRHRSPRPQPLRPPASSAGFQRSTSSACPSRSRPRS